MVCPVFLLFLLFFSSFFSSASLERVGGRKMRKKEVSQKKRFLCRNTHEASRSTHPLLLGRPEDAGGGAEDSPAGFLP
jgi:hypothetical protein